MVFQKRLEYVSNGCQIPAMPRVPRSAKGKRSARKKVEDNQMCAFDLLATLAGKLLAEREGLWTPCKTAGVTSSSVHANMKETLGDESPLKGSVSFDQVSCDESAFSPFAPHGHQAGHNSKLHLKIPESKSVSPLLAKSDASKKDASANEFITSGAKASLPNKCFSDQGYSTSPMVSCVCKADDRNVVPLQRTGCLLCGDPFRIQKLEDPMDLDTKPATLLMSSDSSIEVPPYGVHRRARSSSFPSVRGGMESNADRDDGENTSGCTYPSSAHSKSFKARRTGENSIRKMVMSNYMKADPASYDDGELSNDDGETKAAFRKQKLFYTRQRTRRSSIKRRRMFERCSVSASLGSCGDEAVVDSQVKDGVRLEASDLLAALNGANNISCTRRSHNISYESADYPVKLSIKSFRVPELFIEIPSNATVGSLKRTVMEAVMAILGDGLRVGVLLQGKKVRDDNKTLRQAGISHEDNKMDSLGFTLEPNPPHKSPEVPLACCLPCEPTPHKACSRLQAAAFPPIPISNTNCSESDPCSSSADRTAAAESKALIPMAAANAEALAVVPLRRWRRSDIIQRRIRRPFSVSEVEALVQAVEKLGTGRWRDVKIRAFDNAKHRTYVDLKDKWKTLVHTARISPQQRRGEPVPQELLDRVLSAHAYWSQQQARLPGHGDRFLLA